MDLEFWISVKSKRLSRISTRCNDPEVVNCGKEGKGYLVNNSDSNQKKSKPTNEARPEKMADVVIVTALQDEYEAVRNVFQNIDRGTYKNGTRSSFVELKISKERKVTIAVIMLGRMGLVSAAVVATSALHRFNPDLLVMCGVCAAISDKIKLGDLIVFSDVYDYDSGKYTDNEFLPDSRPYTIDDLVRTCADQLVGNENKAREIRAAWENKAGKPKTELRIHICPAASGAAVIANKEIAESVKSYKRTMGAIDMESYAIAEAANNPMSRKIPWLVVKGVQDYATSKKNDQYREYAAFASAFFAKMFLKEYFSTLFSDAENQ